MHLRLLGSCDGCPSSSVTLQLAVETAILEAAPEIVPSTWTSRRLADARGPVRSQVGSHARSRARARTGRGSTAMTGRDAALAAGTDSGGAMRRAAAQPAGREPAAGPVARRASAASCAARRSPTSTATSSTSRPATCCAPAGPATCCSPPTARAAATTRPCPTATLALPGLRPVARPVGRAADPGRRRLLLPSTRRSAGWRVLPEPGGRHRVAARPRHLGRAWSRPTRCWPRSQPDVEALLVRDGRARRRRGVLPRADRRLLRAGRPLCAGCWRGFDGGAEAHEAIDAFFAEVAGRRARVRP